MRIWFGLILKIMMRTKSYILPDLCYLIKLSVNARNYNSFRGLSPIVPSYPCSVGSRITLSCHRRLVLARDTLKRDGLMVLYASVCRI